MSDVAYAEKAYAGSLNGASPVVPRQPVGAMAQNLGVAIQESHSYMDRIELLLSGPKPPTSTEGAIAREREQSITVQLLFNQQAIQALNNRLETLAGVLGC